MKKNRKQTALAKCLLATIMAMGMMGYTTVWAEDTVTPSPIDKSVAMDKNGAGHIYDAKAHNASGYFWTDLGHAQVQIGSGEQIELFTPFIYHTYNDKWNPQGNNYRPVHTGDNSEMQCEESMAQISVGEFDRIIKSLYTNDITMAKTIYGEAGQAGLKDTVITAVRATPGQGKTVNTYELVRANDKVLAAAIVDTDTKITSNELTFANGTLTSNITDNAGGVYTDSVDGIASQGWVNNKLENIVDTNTINTGMEGSLDGDGKLTLKVNDSAGNNVQAVVEDVASRSWVTGQLENVVDTNTTNTGMEGSLDGDGKLTLKVNDSAGNNVQAVVEDVASRSWVTGQLENVVDTNTTNTGMEGSLDGDGKLTLKVNDSAGNNVQAVVEDVASRSWVTGQIEDQDRYVNGGSIGEDGSITLNVHNGRDVTLEGQMKDARLTDIERDKEAGTATLVVKDRYNPEEVNRLTIDDIASKEQNDRDHAEFREHFNELDHRVDNLGSRVDKVGAGAAALAALHPMDFDPDDKLTFAAGYGNYKGRNAAAVGAFYRPDEKVMLSVGGTFGNGENMVNAGISFSLDRTARVSNSRTAMAKEIVDLRANVANLTALVGQLTAGMGGTIEMDRMKLFPDVPENHWAYEYIGRLAAAGIVEGYPDGMFNGNRMMSRYEFAAMLYRALEKGVKLDHKLVREFEPEMGRIHVARISGADGDRGKIERVRVYGGDNRDHYGSKLK